MMDCESCLGEPDTGLGGSRMDSSIPLSIIRRMCSQEHFGQEALGQILNENTE